MQRWCIVNGVVASALHSDDRMKSKLFYGELQAQERAPKTKKQKPAE